MVEEREQLACTTLAVNITAFPSKPHVATDGTAQKRKSVVHVRGNLPNGRDPTLQRVVGHTVPPTHILERGFGRNPVPVDVVFRKRVVRVVHEVLNDRSRLQLRAESGPFGLPYVRNVLRS